MGSRKVTIFPLHGKQNVIKAYEEFQNHFNRLSRESLVLFLLDGDFDFILSPIASKETPFLHYLSKYDVESYLLDSMQLFDVILDLNKDDLKEVRNCYGEFINMYNTTYQYCLRLSRCNLNGKLNDLGYKYLYFEKYSDMSEEFFLANNLVPYNVNYDDRILQGKMMLNMLHRGCQTLNFNFKISVGDLCIRLVEEVPGNLKEELLNALHTNL